MSWLPLALAGLGLTGVVLALVSTLVQRRLPLSEPLVALVLGVLAGPAALGMVEVGDDLRDVLLLEVSRVLLAWSVMAAALRFPAGTVRPLLRPVLLLLGVAMPVATLLTGAGALALGMPVVLALLVGACLAPTDPVLAASVVTGEPAQRDLPERVRGMLTIESGANDGLGVVLVGLGVAAALPAESLAQAAGLVAWESLGGLAVGAALGWAAGAAFRAALAHHELGQGPELVFTLLLALAVLGVAGLVQVGGVLAVFTAGLVYNALVPSSPRAHQVAVDEGINRYAVLPLFALLGMVLPWSAWADLGWGAVLFLGAVLLLRRPGVVVLLAGALGLRLREAVFAGWFGPMGVSALFYLAHTRDQGVLDPRVFAAVTLAVAVSVVVFGIGAVPGRRLYARVAAGSSPCG